MLLLFSFGYTVCVYVCALSNYDHLSISRSFFFSFKFPLAFSRSVFAFGKAAIELTLDFYQPYAIISSVIQLYALISLLFSQLPILARLTMVGFIVFMFVFYAVNKLYMALFGATVKRCLSLSRMHTVLKIIKQLKVFLSIYAGFCLFCFDWKQYHFQFGFHIRFICGISFTAHNFDIV